ncbi:adenylyl-sulfate kinase [Mucilaginibacter sp. E4BP6]|uniref:adenylyl-sulfate kinase n=1 Tax=Mucilaginibacter sp. E4BP6 TaxID=2723089 RepID=UPI0015CE8EAA|nr:adenylyl-sulfate kinase [Mucilaginibacter sp. E4BP6]NYE67761.1 adenylyl-sulfate kinase [Mucilaginibacter sp. E4BP6]
MEEKLHIVEHQFKISRAERENINGHKAICVWFTGLSGSGKSTLASHLEEELFKKGYKTYVLDGDNIRNGLSKDLTFTEKDRDENLRRIGEVAKLMCDAGIIVIAAFVSPFIHERQMLRNIIGDLYNEVFVDTPLEICEQRDIKGLYKKARRGEIANFTGIGSPYEPPLTAEIRVETKNLSINQSVSLVLENILPKIQL